MAVEPITDIVKQETPDLFSALVKPIGQNIILFITVIAICGIAIFLYAMIQKKKEEEDPFLVEYKSTLKDLKKNAAKPKKLALNVFEPMGAIILLVISLIGAITIWLFSFPMLIALGIIFLIGYLIFDKLGLFNSYTTRVYLLTSTTTRFLGYYINDMLQPKGWQDFLISKTRWLKKPEIYRVNAKGEETITYYKKTKDKKTGVEQVEEMHDSIKLPTNLVRRDNDTILIKGRDTKTYRYYNYIVHTDEQGEAIDLDLIISAREVKRMVNVDLIPALANDFTNAARRLIGANPEVAKFQKMGNEGVEEET